VLDAVAQPGWRFAGWGGACGAALPECALAVDRAARVRARFAPLLSIGTWGRSSVDATG